jgi:hypothetical protein
VKAEFSDCGPEAKKDLAKLEQELAKLKRDTKTKKPKPEPIVMRAADIINMPAPKADPSAHKFSSSDSPPNTVSSSLIPAPVEVSRPSTLPKLDVKLSCQ